jgi:hypothetical protein
MLPRPFIYYVERLSPNCIICLLIEVFHPHAHNGIRTTEIANDVECLVERLTRLSNYTAKLDPMRSA